MEENPCILLAESEQAPPVVRSALEDFAEEVVVVHTMEAALETLGRRPVRAIVAGLHFDDSLMHMLLETVKANPATREIPFLCCRFLPTRLSPAVLEAVARACEELSSFRFVDLPAWEAQYGTEAALARFRRLLRDAMGA